VNLFLHHLLYIYILLFFFFIYNHPFLLFVFYRPVMLESYVANNFQFCPFILISHNIKKEQTKNSFILIFNKDKKKKGKKGGKQKGISFILIFNKDKRKKWVVTLCCILWSYLYSPEHFRQFSMLCFVIVWEIQFVYFSFS
jgi:hypothetical protein